MRQADRFGLHLGEFSFDFGKAIERSREVVDRFRRGLAFLFRKNGIELVQGVGRLRDANTIEVEGHEAISARSIIIATGASPRLLPELALSKRIMTSRQALERKDLPQKILILGGGNIGLEFTSIYLAYGLEVTVVEQLPHILPREDAEIADMVAGILSKRGVVLKTGIGVEKVIENEREVSLLLANGERLSGDALLLSIGVTPNTRGIGLELLDIKTERGYISINEKMRTSLPNVYAIGDITGLLPLAHVAAAQGVIAADEIAGKKTLPLHYERIPRVTYSIPQIASVGLAEEELREKGVSYSVGRFPFSASGLGPATEETDGQVKLLFDSSYGSVLGAHIAGAEASELIAPLALSMESEGTIEEILGTIFAHPTMSEAIKEAALASRGMALNL
ncbi:MAG TPA: dihydrolipoyl dehydrogenase [Cyanobacteria bacterium UBA8530]|nr:dihydrolipoyl dehydrogenase [Cyanobacteria bacterium UBA8530]